MYPQCEEWFHPRLDQGASPKLWNEVTLSSAIREFRELGHPETARAPRLWTTHVHTSKHVHTPKSIRQSSKTSRKSGGNSSVGHSTFIWRKRLAWQAPIIRRSVTFISSLGQKWATLCLR